MILGGFSSSTAQVLSKENETPTCRTPQIPSRNGLVYYYFWEENEQGTIADSTLLTPFSINRIILLDSTKANKTSNLDAKSLMRLVYLSSREVFPKKGVSTTNHISFTQQKALQNNVVIYIKQNGKWKSKIENNILYFNRVDDKLSFQTSRKQLALDTDSIPNPFNSFRVIKYYSSSNDKNKHVVQYTHVLGYKGHELSSFVQQACEHKAKRYLIFSNGYRGPAYDKKESRDEIYLNDRTNYWFKIDDRFIQRLKPDTALYIDGSFSVTTSNHHSKLGFGWNYIRVTKLSSKKSTKYKILNHKMNQKGFEYRYERGKLAGESFLNSIYTTPGKVTRDTIDVVCHSMGYAYSLGFIETVKDHVVLGNYYIIAPENAAQQGMDWTLFQQVWQYGANLDQENPDLLREQDGVAPQVGVLGLEQATCEHIGRIFSPKNWPNKHFIHSHMIYSYDWIFDRILKGQKGYIGK